MPSAEDGVPCLPDEVPCLPDGVPEPLQSLQVPFSWDLCSASAASPKTWGRISLWV